jgi:dUTP pyrophosphatase
MYALVLKHVTLRVRRVREAVKRLRKTKHFDFHVIARPHQWLKTQHRTHSCSTTRRANRRHRCPSAPSTPSPHPTSLLFVSFHIPDPLHSWVGIDDRTAILNDQQPTPTPETSSLPNPMAPAQLPGAQSLPSMPPMSFEPPPPALQVKLLSETAKPPTRGSAFAAGYDIYASKETTVPARGKVLVDTDISIAVPAGTYGRIAPRSGLASKHSIDTGAGVIDADYRGPVKVLLFNFSDVDFKIAVHERIAQLIVERVRK